ncbi:MFS transporter [Bacillus massiliigorillae]|uniref:MFS transporter n=1 Tax=Bacillus massiliigorillae TaxID=1243664 RepID=UPI0003A60904|nr:MFS transporter [Bacillus massiliigorillae]
MENKVQRSQWIQFIALLFGSFICIEAMVFQAPAIPSISQHFELPTYLAGLIILSFYITSASFYPIMGRFADQFGRKKILLFGMVIFAVSEVAAAISPNFSFFLIARVFQGFAVSCILPVAMAYISIIFPPEKRGFATGIFTAVQGCGSMTGAVIAGYLIKIYGWPIIYWVSAVLAILGFIVIKMFIVESKGEKTRSFDLLGAFLLFICAGSMLSVSTLVKSFGAASPYTLGTLALGVVAAIALWIVENRIANPIVELSLFKKRLFALAMIMNLLTVAGYQSFIYIMNFFISSSPGRDVSNVGLFYTIIYAGGVVGAILIGKLADKINNKKLVNFIYLIPIVTIFVFSMINVYTSFSYITILSIILGFSQGAITPILMKYTLSTIPADKLGAGSGVFTTFRDLGTPLGSVTGIIIFSSFTDAFTKSSLSDISKLEGISSNVMGALEQARISGGTKIEQSLANELQSLGITFQDLMTKATAEGLTTALQYSAYIIIGIFALVFIISLLIPKQKAEQTLAAPSKTIELDTSIKSDISV